MKLSIDLWLQNLIKAWKIQWVEEPVGLDCSPTSGSVGGSSTGTLGQGLMHNLCYQLPCLQVTLAFCDVFLLIHYWNNIKLWPYSRDEDTHWGLALAESFAHHKRSVWQHFEVIKDHWILVIPIPKKTVFAGAWQGSQRGRQNISKEKSKNLCYLKRDEKCKVYHKSSWQNMERISSVMCTDIILSELL